MSDALWRTLSALAPKLVGLMDDWWIIAGAAVALHGIHDGEVGDVDLLVSRRDARHLASALGIPLAAGSVDERFRSELFGLWDGAPLPVEIMAGFHVRSAETWSEIMPITREAVMVGGTALFVPSRGELRAMLLAFGRPKDVRRARSMSADEPGRDRPG